MSPYALWLTLAAGSAFTNGLPRHLPDPMHVTTIFFLPQFVPLGLLIFWMIRLAVHRLIWARRDRRITGSSTEKALASGGARHMN
ncbi:MAG TPA: hypothetical protein VHX61_20000 [Rhizomicrobium sp.]|jgi:hypothetical protein|nr:hypothetical protein [Rhizomicrobium sp.]